MLRPAERAVPIDIPVKVYVINSREIAQQMLLHSIECAVIDETVVGHKANDTWPVPEPIDGPAEKPHIGVIKLVFERGCRIFGVGLANATIDLIIGPVLIVLVLALLAHVVRRVANDYCYRCPFLPLDTLRILLIDEAKTFLFVLCKIECVNEAQSLKRSVQSRDFVVGMLDIQRSDVIREQHDLVREHLRSIELRKISL